MSKKDKIQDNMTEEDIKIENGAEGIEDVDNDVKRAAKEEQEQEEETESLAGDLAKLNEKYNQANDKYVRLAAEFDNYRRRAAKERLELISTASEDVIKSLLPILDDCERALEHLKSSDNVEAAKEGTELIFNKLFSLLKSKGLAEIDAVGKDLDTDFQEAVAQFPVEDESKKNKVIDVVQKGYTLNGKVIRFAKVVVGI